jgi:cell cycle sensor histidine kinase DivJ
VIDPQVHEQRHEVVALLRDVTDRHAHETEMREARRAAEDASSAKSRFLATIGHELRTPLNAIVGFSEMMTSGVVGELSPAHREYANIIHQSGHHLLDVVKMLLDMSRLEAGKFELQAEAFDPADLVDPCFKIVENMARERQVQLVTDLPRLLPQLTADERAVRQIVINLLSNAIKFSNEKGVVTLVIKRQGNQLNISVVDRGIGMDREAVSRIGEPFFQAQDGLARRYEGTGLGLSIVKGLVDLHEGTLKVISSPGEGTTITVLLPLNGPATKRAETAEVTPLVREPQVAVTSQWQDEKRRAL